MLRRKFLVGVGAAVVAGCTAEEGATSTPTPEPTRTSTATATDTPTPTQTTENTLEEPEPAVAQPSSVPTHSVRQTEDVSYADVVRYEIHVFPERNIRELSEQDFLQIAKYQVHRVTAEEFVNAIAIAFWGENQRIGNEAAYARSRWAPDGEWKNADLVDTGDYSRHSFIIEGSPDFEFISFEAPTSVEIEQSFTFSVTVKNHGIEEGEVQAYIGELVDENPSQSVTAQVAPDESRTIESDPITVEAIPATGDITYELRGDYDGYLTRDVEVKPAKLEVDDTFSSTYKFSDFDIAIKDVERGDVDDTFEDERYFHVLIAATNTSGETSSSPSGFELVTNSEAYSLLLAEGRDEYETFADVPPGKSIEGWLSERLPKETTLSDVFVRYTGTHQDGEIVVNWTP